MKMVAHKILSPALALAALALNLSVIHETKADSWAPTSAMTTNRCAHTATLLPNGLVLVAGGTADGSSMIASAELYDPTTKTWTETGTMTTNRDFHTATLLPNGKVLVTGGGDYGYEQTQLASAELYDPASGMWTATAAMTTTRVGHTATLLPNGKVLVTGGGTDASNAIASAELYDPTTETWTATGTVGINGSVQTATLLPDGMVLVTGIYGSSAGLYDPTTATWTATGAMTTNRGAYTATLLPNGQVLVAGGILNGSNWVYLSSAELYDPTTETWMATGAMTTNCVLHTATLLPNGQVLVAGGQDQNHIPVASTESYDPASGTWTAAAAMTTNRELHTATLLSNGQVLVAGGHSALGFLSSAELYGAIQGFGITTPSPLPDGMAATAYHLTLEATGGTPPYGWMVASNSLPAGLGLISSGAITGTPTAATTANFRLEVTDSNNAKADKDFTLTINPLVPTRIISLSGNLAFGNVTMGTTAQATLTISNTGNSPLTVSSITYPAGFSGAFSGIIAAGGSTNLTVTFAPTALISYGGTVTVNSDATTGTATIAASGTGTPVPTRIIGLTGNLAFESVAVGTTATRTMTITNTGNSALAVTDIGYPAGFSGAWSGTISAGSSHNVTVTFAPSAFDTYSGTVTVNSDATSGASSLPASGTGAQATSISCDQTVTGTISVPGHTNLYSFSGNAGETVILSAHSLSNGVCTTAGLYAPAGGAIGETPCNWSSTNITLPAAGTYTIGVHNSADTVGDYALCFQSVTAPCGPSIECGTSVAGTISLPGQADRYNINANAGDVIVINATGLSGSLNPEVSLYDPAGHRMTALDFDQSAHLALTITGTYTLFVFDGQLQGTGDYEVVWQEVNNPCNVALPLCSSTTVFTDALLYEFTVPSSDSLFVTIQKETSSWQGWNDSVALTVGGQTVALASGMEDHLLQVANPTPGEYTLDFTGSDSGVAVVQVCTNLPVLALGQWHVGTILRQWGSAWYQVTVPPGQASLYFAVETIGLYSQLKVYSDRIGGTLVGTAYGPSMYLTIPSPAAGTYYAELEDSAYIQNGNQARDHMIKADVVPIAAPPCTTPIITSITPTKGAKPGPVTVTIEGQCLSSNATVCLQRTDYDNVCAIAVTGISNRVDYATFNLSSAAPGDWTLVLTNPDKQSATAPTPFTVVETGGETGAAHIELELGLIGRSQIRAGFTQTYILRYANTNLIDASNVLLWVGVTPSARLTLPDVTSFGLPQPSPLSLFVEGIMLPRVAAGESGNITVRLTAPTTPSVIRLCAGLCDTSSAAPDITRGTCMDIQVVTSISPEDKYGPSGYDASGTATNRLKRWLPADQVLDYRIDFWNKEDAPAATVDVFINDQLSSNLNWSTFKFTEIGFLDWRVPLEPCQYFNVDVPNVQIDLSHYYPGAPVVNLTVNVQGTFNPTTGQIAWEFHALDPITRQPPEEPLAGFLPPITTNGWEVGWVDFSAAPLAGLPTSTIISNQSYVKFDVDVFKPAPPGGPFVNTLDSLSPQSAVQPLPATVASSTFAVQWSGTDGPNGSGIRDYTIFVSENNGSYSNWLVNATTTSGTFTGQVGHTYAFYSVARDNVGNQEAKSALPEATTQVVSTQVLNISKLQTKLNFAKANADSCSLTATLDPGAGFNPSGKSATLNIGGAQMSFTLDSKGRDVGSPGACRLSYSKSKKVWTFTAILKGGNYQTAWEAYGMVNANLPQPTAAVSLPVTLLLDQETFVGEKILTYKAKPGKSGTAK